MPKGHSHHGGLTTDRHVALEVRSRGDSMSLRECNPKTHPMAASPCLEASADIYRDMYINPKDATMILPGPYDNPPVHDMVAQKVKLGHQHYHSNQAAAAITYVVKYGSSTNGHTKCATHVNVNGMMASIWPSAR